MTKVEVVRSGGVGIVTLADPERRNAITVDMAQEIDAAFTDLEADESVHAVVVTGKGSVFCSGADLGLVIRGEPAIYRQLYAAFLRVARCPLPTIAAINGPATGAGLNLLLCCDIRISVPKAQFVARFLDLGLHPGGGSTWMLARAVGEQRARSMMLCGEELDGYAAVAAGLALRCVEPEALLDEALQLGARAASVPRPILIRTGQTMSKMPTVGSLTEAVEIEAEAQAWSATQPYFTDRVAALQTKIAERRR